MLKRNGCYKGDLSGRSDDTQEELNKFIQKVNMKRSPKMGSIELVNASIGEFESWLRDAVPIEGVNRPGFAGGSNS
jgi:hypothetical protein